MIFGENLEHPSKRLTSAPRMKRMPAKWNDSATVAADRGCVHGVGGAALWTLAQYGSFFVCAWWISRWVGVDRFGAFGQGLALTAMLSAAITFRLEYAGQLERRHHRAAALFGLAEGGAWICCALLLIALAVVQQWMRVPLWLWAGACALAPQAGMLIRAAAAARRDQVVHAAALRSAPALVMVLLLMLAWGMNWDHGIEWSIPLSAWICWLTARFSGIRRKTVRHRHGRLMPLAAFHLRFVRAELPGFLLNVSANHGQVLLIGLLGGDAAAGTASLALRIAMLPTSLFGLALTDRLRAHVVAIGKTASLPIMMHRTLKSMTMLSLATHALAAIAVFLLLPSIFPAQGSILITMIMLLLPLGVIRLVASPLAFMLPWRGWLGLSLFGQCLLFACALLSVMLGFSAAGLTGVAAAYTVSAACVYLGYVYAALRATRPAFEPRNGS
jgi:hypothetical protein